MPSPPWTFPARGTWIEILFHWIHFTPSVDVPRKGNVDRNSLEAR